MGTGSADLVSFQQSVTTYTDDDAKTHACPGGILRPRIRLATEVKTASCGCAPSLLSENPKI